jgi:hypothetical protein
MQPTDIFARAYEAAIRDLDAWVNAHRLVANIDCERTASYWHVRVTPIAENACPAELILHRSQRCDLSAGAETYENQPIGDPSRWRMVLDAIVAGDVIVRRWVTSATAAVAKVETVISLADGTEWRGERILVALPGSATERRDQHVLPYQRRKAA